MSTDIEKTLQQLQQIDLQEKKLDTLINIFGQISQVIEFKTVDREMIISLIEDSAVQAKVSEIKTKEYQEKKKRFEKNTPRGVKISLDNISLNGSYIFELKSWIAEQKEIDQLITATVLKTTAKAMQLEVEDKQIWIPKSQILQANLEARS